MRSLPFDRPKTFIAVLMTDIKKAKYCFLLMGLIVSTSLNGQQDYLGTKTPERDRNQVGNIKDVLQISARFQFQTLFNNLNNRSTSAGIRRARLKLKGHLLSGEIGYKMELGFSSRDMSGVSEFTKNTPRIILDAFVTWKVNDNWVLLVGQAKLPGNRERIVSSRDLQFVDRSILNKNFNIDRDIGLQLENTSKIGKEFYLVGTLSISQGEGRNVHVPGIEGFQYTTKLELFPFGILPNNEAYISGDQNRHIDPKWAIAAAYNYNDNAIRTNGNLGNFMVNSTGFHQTDISTYFMDTIFKYKGFSVMAEYARRNTGDYIAKEMDGTVALDPNGIPTGDYVPIGSAYNIQMGNMFKRNWELAARFSKLSFKNDRFNEMKQYTMGLSKYLKGHQIKVQTDLSYSNIPKNDDYWMFRIQLEAGF